MGYSTGMPAPPSTPSARRAELLEASYRYVLEHGIVDTSLRPLAEAVGSSTRVLMYLFGSKDGLVRALLARAREDELRGLTRIAPGGDLGDAVRALWAWLSAPAHTLVLRLWVESYSRSLVSPEGPWAGFAHDSVSDWLQLLESARPGAGHDADADRTLALAVLRGALLDLLATADRDRIDRAVAAAATFLSARG